VAVSSDFYTILYLDHLSFFKLKKGFCHPSCLWRY